MSAISRLQAIQSNKLFETFIIVVIMASALIVGLKTYEMPGSVIIAVYWLDVLITLIFIVELSIRFAAEERKLNFFKSGWNVFDLLIVTISLIPIDNTDMALVARLVRVFRVLRMVSIVPELRTLLNSLLIALPRLGYVVALMFIIFYMYAAVGSLVFNEINEFLWGDIAVSMLTLFRVMTFEDWTDVMYEVMAVYGWAWLYFVSFIFLTAFAFLNMVIGIVVNVLEEEHERERAANPDEVTLRELKQEILALRVLIADQNKQRE